MIPLAAMPLDPTLGLINLAQKETIKPFSLFAAIYMPPTS
jgi:hypothetical protein